MEYNTGTYIVNSRGYKLYCRYWKPEDKPKAIVFIAHGFTEHSEYYEMLAQEIVKLGCFVFAHDHVGHGRSEGPRVLIQDKDEYVNDVFHHTDMIKETFPDLPLFYFGHSMGGAIGASAAIKRPHYFTGIVLCGPSVSLSSKVIETVVKSVASVIGWLLPSFPLFALNRDAVTRNADIMEKRINDPLSWHGFAKAGWAYAMLRFVQDIVDNASQIECPLLLVHGDEDGICDKEGSKKLYDICSSTDKTLKLYPKAYHNLLEEPEGVSENVLNDITQWIQQRIK